MARVIAHRGSRQEAPENTRAALLAAIETPGVYGIEFDVELADEPVVLHQETMVPDESFEKLQPASRNFESRDWVSEHTAEEIVRLDAGSWFGDQFTSERVPRLRDVLALDWGRRHRFIELKDPTYWGVRNAEWPHRMVAAVAPHLSNEHDVSIISFNPRILAEVQRVMPEIPRILALWTEWQEKPAEALAEAMAVGASAISLSDQMVLARPAWVDEIKRAGLEVHVYPVSPAVNEPGYADWTAAGQHGTWDTLCLFGVDAIVTDFPRQLLEYMATSIRQV